MAEREALQKRYAYQEMSNKVEQADRSQLMPRSGEATGEVESLWGRKQLGRMGDNVMATKRDRPQEVVDKLKEAAAKAKKKRKREGAGAGGEINYEKKKDSILNSSGGQTLLDLENVGGGGGIEGSRSRYQPSHGSSRAAYESLLHLLSSKAFLGSQPPSILHDAAHEILAILKSEHYRDPDRQREISVLLGMKPTSSTSSSTSSLSNEHFAQMVALGKAIDDYSDSTTNNNNNTNVEDEMGVAVVFDDESEDDDDQDQMIETNEVVDVDESSTEGGTDNDDDDVITDPNDPNQEDDQLEERLVLKESSSKNQTKSSLSIKENNNSSSLNLLSIDAHWLQRQLSHHFSDTNNDAEVTAKMANEILDIIHPSSNDTRECENKLLLLLGFDLFHFMKTLLKNRLAIWACVTLKRIGSDNNNDISDGNADGDDNNSNEEAKFKKLQVENILKSTEEGTIVWNTIHSKATAEHWTKERMDGFQNQTKLEADRILKSSNIGSEQEESNQEDAATNLSDKPIELDLTSLSFREGSHLMSNKKCSLPSSSFRAMRKNYEEVHVPATKSIIPRSEKLIQIKELPLWTQVAFRNMTSLNRIQSKMCNVSLYTCENLLLCAPTGAGKTNVAMLTMLNVLSQFKISDNEFDLSKFKIVYIAPMKALVQEIVKNFGKRLAPFNVTVNELSGDSSLTRQQIVDTQVIVTTPEKWDVMTRQGDGRAFTSLVKLVIFDEIHLLHDERGPVLESIISRMIRHVEFSSSNNENAIRLVGLSATLPNYTDVATLLRVDPKKGMFFFDFTYRPVPLQMQYIGITERNAFKRLNLQNELCYDRAIIQRKQNQQMLIFVHSRAECGKTAKALRDFALERKELEYFVRNDSASQEILREEVGTVKHKDLKDVLTYGFAIHHAGMCRSDRELVEDLFADRHIGVLICTATLAWGVNLPAHCVIIKGTQIYDPSKGRWSELSPLDVLQMLGRAGRPQYDTEGEGIILTAHSELQYYLSLTNLQLPVESQLIKSLPEHLNAEVVLGNITTIQEAMDWLSYTFLYIRMIQNPTLYGIVNPEETLKNDPTLKQRRLDLVHTASCVLEKCHLLRYDKNTGALTSTPLGKIASQYYITHTSMSVYQRHMTPTMSDIDLLRLFSLSGEFTHITVREEEKIELSKLVSQVPIPIKESPNEPSAKVNILLQAYISRLKLDGLALVADMAFIHQSAGRIMRALFEIALKRNWASLTQLTLNYANMISSKVWYCQSPLRQIPNVPDVICRKLERKSDVEWYRYSDLTPTDLGELVGIPKMGRSLHKLVHQFPKLDVSAHVQPITRSLLRVEVTILPDFQFDPKVHKFVQFFHVWVEDVNGQSILHHELFVLESSRWDEEHTLLFTVPLLDPLPPAYFLRVYADQWLHCSIVLPISLQSMILPSKFSPPTELLDLQPLSVTALPEAFQGLYDGVVNNMGEFNAIQTQTFHELYKSDHNVLVAAPTGSGKTVCAEFAILRMLSTNPNGKCVYVAPKDEILLQIYNNWKKRFGTLLGSNDDEGPVLRFTGETTTDLQALSRGKIILATINQWDAFSRRWKQRRKTMQSISLFIADEMHFLGGDVGPTFEIVLSRMRYIATSQQQSSSPLRIVALSASIANARDVSDWLGVSPKSYFHFSPKVRPLPLEIFFQSFDHINYSSRLLAMSKPLYMAVMRHSQPIKCKDQEAGRTVLVCSQNSIIFVPSKRQAQLTAIDLMAYRESMENGNFLGERCLNQPEEMDKLRNVASRLRDTTLQQIVIEGIGYIYEGMSSDDFQAILELYLNNSLQVLLCPAPQCWTLVSSSPSIQRIKAHVVIIMGTESYSGIEKRHIDYPVADVLQMMGAHALHKCVFFCHTPKKDHWKKLLYEPLPIESHLDHYLHDHFNSEIVTRTITSMQDGVDYMTWSFLYRRLTKNPNYYNLQGTSQEHISEFLSEMVETVFADLEESKCCQIEQRQDEEDEEVDVVSPLNLGMISAYYYIHYTTMELMSSSITAKTKTRGIIEILCASSEFTSLLSIRSQSEVKTLKSLARTLNYPLDKNALFNDPNTKTSILLQSHFSRTLLPSSDLRTDQSKILVQCIPLIQAMVDVISSHGWLKPALAAMEISQMVVQGLWNKDHVLLQIPHFDKEIIDRCTSYKGSGDADDDEPIESVDDILTLDDDVRNMLLNLPNKKMMDVAIFCNNYPSIDVSYKIIYDEEGQDCVAAGEPVQVAIQLQKEGDDEDEDDHDEVDLVSAPLFPQPKKEAYWIVIGDTSSNTLLSLKRVVLQQRKGQKLVLEFVAPDPGDYNLSLFCISDSYLGCDLEFSVELSVVVPDDSDDDDDDDDDDEEEEEEEEEAKEEAAAEAIDEEDNEQDK